MSEFLIYFVQAGDFVKIGITTSIETRMRSIRSHCPFPATLLKTVSGGYRREQHIHSQIYHLRAYREWFHDTPELRVFISELPVESAIPEYHPNRRGGVGRRRDAIQYFPPLWLENLLNEHNIDIYQLRVQTSLHEDTICRWAALTREDTGSLNISISGKVAKALGIKHSEFEAMREAGLNRADPAAVIAAMQSIGVVNSAAGEGEE